MKAININNEWVTGQQYASVNNTKIDFTTGLPTIFNGLANYHTTDDWYEDGWREIIDLPYDVNVLKKTNILEELGNHPNKFCQYVLENLTPQEIQERENLIDANRLPNLYAQVKELKIGALAIAIGKPELNNEDEILAMREIYERKYKIATNQIADTYNLLENEATEIGVDFETYKAIIRGLYAQGESTYDAFLAMIDRARMKALTAYDLGNKQKFDNILQIMNDVQRSVTPQEALTLMQQILAM